MMITNTGDFNYDKITSDEFEGKHFVEASPYDELWGVGLGEADELIKDPKNWKGENWLGKILDDVRVALLEGYTEDIKY